MKGFKFVLATVLLILFMIPFMVFAQEEQVTEETAEDNRVTLYLFRGEGCSHCAEFEEWLNSIQEEYGQYYKLVDYETWYNEENAELMNKVAESRNEAEDLGVPYIIVGNQSWKGFTDSYKQEILDKIKSEYETPVSERVDALKHIDSNKKKEESVVKGSDVVISLVIVVVVLGAGYGLYRARKSTN